MWVQIPLDSLTRIASRHTGSEATMNICECNPCVLKDVEAIKVKWFTKGIGRQEAYLCENHRMELFEMIKGLLALNEAYFIIK